MSKLIRCAVYTRKSTEEGLEQDFNSLQAQREAGEAFIKSQKHEGWQLIKTHYDDGGFSGGSMDRPALQQLMRDIEAGKVDVIVVYKVDRLSRSLHDFAKMVEVFDRHKVSFVSVTQQFNTTTSMGRLTLNVLLSFAQFEREVTGERIRDKIAASKKKGMWMGGVVPLGYDVKDRKLVISPAEAETVRFIYKRYLELGCVRALCNDLKQKKIVTKTIPNRPGSGGRPFSRGGLYHLLNNPIFIGQIRFREAIYDGQHEPIVDVETWDAVQKLLADNRAGLIGTYHKDESAPLRGKLYDALTGEQLAVTYGNKKGRRYRYYLTRSLKTDTRSNAPTGWRLSGPVIEKTVDAVVRSMLADQSSIISALAGADAPAVVIPHVLARAKTVLGESDSILEDYVQRVSIGPDRIEVKLSLAKLIPEGMDLPDIFISQTKPMRMQRRNHWAVKDIDLYRFLLRTVRPRRQQPTVFHIPEHESIEQALASAMMPFDPRFTDVYNSIKQAADGAGLRCRRADDIWENAAIIQDVVSLIDRSRIVICDCSGKNPNVFYEAGIAHTLGREVILITQNEQDIPFDLRHLRYIPYLNNAEGLTALTRALQSRLQTILGH